MLCALASPVTVLAKSQTTSPTSVQAGQAPTSGIGVLTRPKTAAELAWEQQKEAAAQAWMAQTHGGHVASPGAIQPMGVIRPSCIIDPNTGQCATLHNVTITGGGEYIQEPSIAPNDQPNWCGPSAATAAMLHWNYNAVVNHGSETVPNNPDTGYVTYSGAQGYMAWLAANVYIPADNHYGVSQVPYRLNSPIVWVADGLNVATGTSYYIVHTSSSAADMMANVEADIGHDNHPMIYLADARSLPEWHNLTAELDHYVEGYGYSYYDNGTYDTNNVFYADAIASTDHRATAGDYSRTWNEMWTAVHNAFSDFVV